MYSAESTPYRAWEFGQAEDVVEEDMVNESPKGSVKSNLV